MTVVHQNKSETEFLYKEVFLSRSYLRHGIALPANACVFDVGANIGMFSLLAALECESARIFAFEPIPATAETLRLNMEMQGVNARVFACGLAGEAKQATFTWYPHVSIFSGRFADSAEESGIIRSFLLSLEDGVAESGDLTTGQIEEIVKERLVGTPVVCPLRTVSSIIREHGLERIDLLKIDAEKSELEVLAGIDEKDWSKVQQIAIEVHNTKGQEETIRGILESRGFDVAVDQDPWFRNTSNVNLYARRTGAAEAIPAAPFAGREWRSIPALKADIQKHLKQSLPEYMIPSRIVLVESFPLTANGKVDRKALAAAEDSGRESTAFVPPRTPEEDAIAEIWRGLLGLERVGIHENFFDLGGHSLLAMQLVSRLRDRFSVELPVRTLFEGPTVAELAAALRTLRQAGAGKAPQLVARARDGYRVQSAGAQKF
jgi:FkbM family methyltransferase